MNYNFRYDAENDVLYFITPSGEEKEIVFATESDGD